MHVQQGTQTLKPVSFGPLYFYRQLFLTQAVSSSECPPYPGCSFYGKLAGDGSVTSTTNGSFCLASAEFLNWKYQKIMEIFEEIHLRSGNQKSKINSLLKKNFPGSTFQYPGCLAGGAYTGVCVLSLPGVSAFFHLGRRIFILCLFLCSVSLWRYLVMCVWLCM